MVNKKSSWPISRVLCLAKGKVPVIYLRCMSPYNFSGLPSDMGRATLVGVGLHDLTTPKMHSPTCYHAAGGLLPHLLTLTKPFHLSKEHLEKPGGSFLLHYSTFADSFPLGSRMLCVARTFLFCHKHQRQTGRLFSLCKVKHLNWNIEISFLQSVGYPTCQAYF